MALGVAGERDVQLENRDRQHVRKHHLAIKVVDQERKYTMVAEHSV